MASVGDSARAEVSLLETLESALHRLHEFDSAPGPHTTTAAEHLAEEGYKGFVNWYTKLGGSANSRAGVTSQNDVNGQDASVQIRELGSQTASNMDGPAVNGMVDDVSVDSYPFDFNLLNMDANAALFTPNFRENGNSERELFENLFWMPK
ncbi:hypothetical protein N0V86_009836 [Didymella sp. IMI 355093]|nr:hypothetical protein N0V86_009836 [Didymella sp. IMI 355093]